MNKTATSSADRRSLVAAIALLAVPIFLLLLFFFRHQFVTTYATLFYMPGVSRHFDQTFEPINPQLRELGLSYAGQIQQQNTWHSESCDVSGYGGSVTCSKAQGNSQSSTTKDFIENWKQRSPALETYLFDNGWQKTGNTQQSIAALFDETQTNQARTVHYSKVQGNMHCRIAISYIVGGSTSLDEHCWRNLDFPDIHNRNAV